MRNSKWFKLVWVAPIAVVALAILVLAAQAFRQLPAVRSFLHDFPGASALPEGAPVGFPAWLAWQHFLNTLFIVLIVRTGWQIHTTKRASIFWVRNNTGLIKTAGRPIRISLTVWAHLAFDAFWVLNGVMFYVLLFSTGQWMRLIPTRWDSVPNALSAVLQYVSLSWPTDNGWVNYNSLQLFAYFTTVFIAAPLAILSGIRMSGAWPLKARRLNKLFTFGAARSLHFAVMVYFVGFVIIHVTLVLATGALRNLNHMYGGSDQVNWWGFSIFSASLIVIAAVWIAVRPTILSRVAALTGTVTAARTS